jgi:aryl-alcohol dehydrogenase-like predicted oxidoreductase
MVNSGIPYIERNGLKLSRFMLGTAQLGMGNYGVNNRLGSVNDQELLDYCEQKGINCYDTAHEYGDAEVKLGQFFKGKEPPFIVSKLKVDLQLNSVLELERQMVGKAEHILSRLQLSAIPSLMIHDPAVLQVYGPSVSRILNRMKRDGIIQRGGVSFGADPINQYKYSAALIQDDIYEMIQLPVNLFDRRLIQCGGLQDFANRGKWVVARSVFLQGLFFMNKQSLPEKLTEGAALLERLHELARSEEMSIAELALAYVRDLEGVHCLVIGAESPEQIKVNLELMNCPSLSERTRIRIEETFADIPQIYITPFMWK